jgi:hypothetical protein
MAATPFAMGSHHIRLTETFMANDQTSILKPPTRTPSEERYFRAAQQFADQCPTAGFNFEWLVDLNEHRKED